MAFYPGQRVECIDDTGRGWFFGFDYPVKGGVYTVRSIFPSERGIPCLRLEEILNRTVRLQDGEVMEPGFDARRFRPLTDISVFERLLASLPTDLPEDLPADPVEPQLPEVPVLAWMG